MRWLICRVLKVMDTLYFSFSIFSLLFSALSKKRKNAAQGFSVQRLVNFLFDGCFLFSNSSFHFCTRKRPYFFQNKVVAKVICKKERNDLYGHGGFPLSFFMQFWVIIAPVQHPVSYTHQMCIRDRARVDVVGGECTK